MQSPTTNADLAALYERRAQLLMDMYVAKGAYIRAGGGLYKKQGFKGQHALLREEFRARQWLVRDIDQEVRAAMGFRALTRDEMIAYRRAQKLKNAVNKK